MANSSPAIAGGSDVFDYDYTPGAVAADIFLARPLCLAVTIAGSGLFVATLPITAMCGGANASARALVFAPAKETFVRKLGNLSGLEK